MKQLTLLFLTALFALGACTRNDGGVSDLYGQWQLTGVERDGISDTDYKGGVYWSFQNATIEMKQTYPDHSYFQTFGNYRVADATLFLDFPDERYAPLLGLPRQAELQIVRLHGSQLILAYGDPATVYTFRKW